MGLGGAPVWLGGILQIGRRPVDKLSRFEISAKPGNVALRRSAEKLFVLAAEVGWVFIAHTDCGARGIQVFTEHQAAGFLEAYLFVKLQWAHRCDRLEVMMKSRNAHPEFTRDTFDLEGLVEVFAQTADRLGNAPRVCRR